jgi:hypothetical protein
MKVLPFRRGKRKVGKEMPRKRLRGNTMALYAAFLVTVGLPLLALGVDFSRVELFRVKLRSATEAACEAYANSLDIAAFRDGEGIKLKNAYHNAYIVFHDAMPQEASFVANETRKDDGGAEKVVIICTAGLSIHPVIPLISNYYISTTATSKTKFSTSPGAQ